MSRLGSESRFPGGGGAGGDWQGIRPRADNPMSWSLPMLRIARIDVRIHVFFLAVVLIELARAAVAGREAGAGVPLGVAWTAVALIFLWWLVLAHECAHQLASRSLGGTSTEVLMWPLGGLALPQLPQSVRAHLLVALAGPAVNVLIFVVLAIVLWFGTGSYAATVPALLDPDGIMKGIITTAGSWWLTALFIAHWMNLLLLAANLLPIFPFDGGRVLHAILWQSQGYVAAMRVTARVGLICAVCFGIAAIIFERGAWAAYMIAIAFFCGYVCYSSLRKLEFTESEMEKPTDEGWTPVESEEDVVARISGAPTEDVQQSRREEKAQESASQLDVVLDKIRVSGIKSLSFRERRLLRKATRQRRKDSS